MNNILYNKYNAQSIIDALTSTSNDTSFGTYDGEAFALTPKPPVVAPTVDPSLQTLDISAGRVVPFPEVKQKNPTPYIATQRKGVNLSETEPGKIPDASSIEGTLTKEQVKNYTNSALYGIKAITALANGFTANISYRMQSRNKEWQARQNLRSAELLMLNQREINRAAQMDANVYRMQGAITKSNQKVAMAQSGFAVGKGIYRNTLDTTDIRTNYNTSAIILKAELQNAELTRKAGLYEAESIINKADAKIARAQGRAAIWEGAMNAVSYLAASGASFYVGKYGYGDTAKTVTKKD